MLFSVIIIVILALAAFHGWRKGLVAELFSFIGFLLATALAFIFVTPGADMLRMIANRFFSANALENNLFWLGSSFLLIFVLAIVVIKLVGHLINGIVSLPILRQLNGLAGALLSGAIWWFTICLVLNGLLLLGNSFVDTQYAESPVAQTVSFHSPQVFRKMIQH